MSFPARVLIVPALLSVLMLFGCTVKLVPSEASQLSKRTMLLQA